ncbi:MAG: hypothetical protein AAF533_10840 [Acidobacteriota bacterium]
MLSLDSPRWHELRHAYGPADDVPDMLRRLAALPRHDSWVDDDPVWDDLWSCLCHQGTVYSSSFAAVPHLVAVGQGQARGARSRLWCLVGAIAASRDGPAPLPDLAEAYRSALSVLADDLAVLVVEEPDAKTALYLLAALAGVLGEGHLERVLDQVGDDRAPLTCSHCEAVLLMLVSESGTIDVSETDERWNPIGERKVVQAPETGPSSTVLRRLVELARESGHESLTRALFTLGGTSTCPSCGAGISIEARLREQP